ncbi:MAG TPA: sensor histidine kinase [Eubacterium sp.]|nr:sensor histidine kinase [Eubacterium sp.]
MVRMMKFKDYFLNKITEILGTYFVLFLMLEFLYIIGNTFSVVFMIGMVIAVLIMTKYLMDWYRKKKYFEIITERVKDLKEPWLIAELLPVSYTIEDEIYQELLRKVGSSAIEEIHKIEDEQKEYEDYIEQWIHEVKTPITSIHLMLENRISENPGLKRDLNVELSRLENDVELALYYARSEQIYRDYLIQKLNVRKVLLKVVNKNRTVIMNSSVAIDLDCDEALYAYGDEKWLVFMLTQVLLNAIKYKAEADAKVVMRAKRDNKRIVLNIIDNGKGIKKEELPRIFDKGFTGSNGRDNEKSTGMGLYLVHKLCEKLEIDIKADSVYGEFTEISFSLKNVC